MTVIPFPRHRLSRPSLCGCDGEGRCPICDGGLALCRTCYGAEASLPTHCPQRPMTDYEQDAVASGELDFVDGRWVEIGGAYRGEKS